MARYSPDVRSQAVRMVLDDGRSAAAVAAELGLVASTLRKWVRAEWQRQREQWWTDQVRPAFDYLLSRGFALTSVRGGDWWEVAVIYRADPVAVIVVYSIEFRRVEAKLIRSALLDLPDRQPFFVTGIPGRNGHLADALLAEAYPDRKQRSKVIRSHLGLEPDQVTAALAFWAGVLRDHAADFLRGDLSLLDRWDRDRPMVATVHVPHAATPDQEATAVAHTRATLTAAALPSTPIAVHHYPTPVTPDP